MAMHGQWSDILIVGGALFGAVLAHERWSTPDYDPYFNLPRPEKSAPNIIGLVVYALLIAGTAHTFRGFLYLFLEPVGAGVVAFALTTPFFEKRGLRHQRERIRRWEASEPS